MGKRHDLIASYGGRFHRVISHNEYKEVRCNSKLHFTENTLRSILTFSDLFNKHFSVDFDICAKGGKDSIAYARLRIMDKLRTQQIAVVKIVLNCSYTGLLIKMKDIRTDTVFTENCDEGEEEHTFRYFCDRLTTAHKPLINPSKLKGWELTKTKNYMVTIAKPEEETQYKNVLTGNKYIVRSNTIEPNKRCIRVKGILNEVWVDYPQKICDEYTMVDGSGLTLIGLIDLFNITNTSLEVRRKADVEYGYLILPEKATGSIVRTYTGDIIYINDIKEGVPNVLIAPVENGVINYGKIEVVDYRLFREMFKG